MNKTARKLVPAIFMLVIAMVFASTSSYAWFSMNTTVSASGMQVTAKSNSVFLQIINEDGTFSDTATQNSATAKTGSKDLYPTTVGSAVAATSVTALAGTEAKTALKWATAQSNDPAVSTRNGNFTDVTAAANATDTTNTYTLINHFKVRLNPASGSVSATNLTVGNVTITAVSANAKSMISAVRLLVVSTNGVVVYKLNADGDAYEVASGATSSIIANTVTNDSDPNTATDVYAYIFFEGEDTTVFTNNLASSEYYNVTFDLTVTPGT